MRHEARRTRVRALAAVTVLCLGSSALPTVVHGLAPLAGTLDSALPREPQRTPEGLAAAGLDTLQYGDAAAQIDLVQPPEATNAGDAEVTHPLSIPPGRAGMEPRLALAYSSSGGNGWLGVGWSLPTGAVTIDTRWGVPRYSATAETETYQLDGAMLTPNALRDAPLPREPERVFQRRVEGEFELIVRHGTSPSTYWFEAATKTGSRRYYGGTPEGGRDRSAILETADGNGYRWALVQERDAISGNTVTYTYTKPAGRGVGLDPAAPIGQGLYLSTIQYTGLVSPVPRSDPDWRPNDPAYEVRFVRDSALGEPLRRDVTVDARGGLIEVTADLLRRVDVYHRGALVRRFTLNYAPGAFDKTLLRSVDRAGADGVAYATHTFTYYDDVRPDGINYAGFTADPVPWQTGNDSIIAPAIPAGQREASALGGTEGGGAEGRVYLGFNPFKEGKSGSFGVSFAFGGGESKGRVELLDVNGDGLPDKVFESNGTIWFRPNRSGPNGTTVFGDRVPITGVGTLSRDRNFAFTIGVEVNVVVAVMYHHTFAWAWGRSYFQDVNADGLPDYVDDGNVLFNSMRSGTPVFASSSGLTTVPLGTGAPVAAAAIPDTSAAEASQREQAPLQDTLRRWRAPWSGTIAIGGAVTLTAPATGEPAGDGVRVAIQREGDELWSTTIAPGDTAPRSPIGVATVAVARGQDVYFRLQSRDDGATDRVTWSPTITYLDVVTAPDVNGLDPYAYGAAEDFTLAGYPGIAAVAPVDGTVHASGTFTKSRRTSDDVRLQLLKNGTVVHEVPVSAETIGTVPFEADVAVLGPRGTNGATVDRLAVRLAVTSPVDLSAFTWQPRIVYTSATRAGQPVETVDGQGQPIFDLQIPVDYQVYPYDDLVAPQQPWRSDLGRTVDVDASLSFGATQDVDGEVHVTVKERRTNPAAGDPPGRAVFHRTLTVAGGRVVAASGDAQLTLVNGRDYWVDVSAPSPVLGANWTGATVTFEYDEDGERRTVTPTQARHWAAPTGDVFPMPYRGWGAAGYNAGPRAGEGLAAAPVDERRLVLDVASLPKNPAEPTSTVPGKEFPRYPEEVSSEVPDLTKASAYNFLPYLVRDAAGAVTERWRGSKANIHVSATGASSSRTGPDSVALPTLTVGASARGVTKLSTSNSDAIAVSLIAGVSRASGSGEGFLDFMDMNGDAFPDIVGRLVQYTLPRGGLEPAATTSMGGNVREDAASSESVGLGGNIADIKAAASGDVGTPQNVDAVSRPAGGAGAASSQPAGEGDDSSGPTAGLSGGLGFGSSNADDDSPFDPLLEKDLADMNGDGLPDRVRTYTDGRMTVELNLGYRFTGVELAWPGRRLEESSSRAFSVGGSAGFQMPSREFSGGIGFSGEAEKPVYTWVDLNGDGLVDRVRQDGAAVRVSFGTGGGIGPELSWGTFRSGEIARTVSAGWNVGADFTISIGPLCVIVKLCYLIINPGAGGGPTMARQELELVDVDGDGYPDHVESTRDDSMSVSRNTTGRTNLLRAVRNPLGGEIRIGYERDGNTTAQPFSKWVMNRVDVDDRRPGAGADVRTSTFTYRGNRWDPLEREILGYATVVEQQHDTTQPALPVLRRYVRTYRNGTVFDMGLLASEVLRDGPTDTLLRSTTLSHEFAVPDVAAFPGPGTTERPDAIDPVTRLTRSLAVRTVSTTYTWSPSGQGPKSTTLSFTYDALGNVTRILDQGEPDIADDDVASVTTYSDCRANTWVNRPVHVVVTGSTGQVLRERIADNDDLCENSAPTELRERIDDGWAVTNLSFDPWGSYDEITYPENETGERYTVQYLFDADRHTDIVKVWDSHDPAPADESQWDAAWAPMTATFDRNGQVTSRTDANGHRTTFGYDPQGRLAWITGPYEQGRVDAAGNPVRTVEYRYAPDAAYAHAIARHFDAFHPDDPIETVRFLDGIGRETQTKADGTVFRGAGLPAADVMVVAGAVSFDALGRPVRTWYPTTEPLGTIGIHNPGTSAVPTETRYDAADQVVSVTNPDGSRTTTEYGVASVGGQGPALFRTRTTDAEGRVTEAYSTVRDTTLAVHEVPGQPEAQLTRYRYSGLGELVGVTDNVGNVTTHIYDQLGRRTSTDTPDGGLVVTEHDLAGNVTRVVTPNLRATGQAIRYGYDVDRLVAVDNPPGTPDVAYTYGQRGAAGNTARRIATVADGARVQQRTYDAAGAPASETTTMLVHNLVEPIEARLTWTTSFSYEALGRMRSMTYPDGEVLTYDHDTGGLPTSAIGTKAGFTYPYVTRLEYDEFAARRFQVAGNGVTTTTSYDPLTRRLNRIQTLTPVREIQDQTYTYDRVGNVLSLVNDMPPASASLFGGPSTQRFTYDALYRLTGATGTAEVAPRKRRDYSLAIAYDAAGNLTRKTQRDQIFTNGPNGVTQAPTTYDLRLQYDGTTHQLARTGTRAWSHDLDGNTTGWADDATGQLRTMTWDAQGRMTSVADQGSTTTYAYDDRGRLGIERGPGGETAFVNPWYRVRNGSVAWKEVWIGDRRIATKRQFADGSEELQRYWFHPDLQGSTNMVTDASGLAFQHLEYFPGGETWIHERSDVFRTPELFAGAYYDEFRDLYGMGQRWYAPKEQLFMSTDPALVQEPLQTVTDPNLLPAYTYAENNPGRFVDRDGRLPRSAQEAAYASFARSPMSAAEMVGLVSATLSVADRTGPKLLRFLRNAPSSPAFARLKKVATFEPAPLFKIDLVRTRDGLQLKKVKVGLVFGSRPIYRSAAAKAAKAGR